jgi:hypothetical protein
MAVTATVLVLDFIQLQTRVPVEAAPGIASEETAALPVDPEFTTTVTLPRRADSRRGTPLRRADPQLSATMTFELVGDGRLLATGTIGPGTAKAFAAEIKKRGAYVKTVVLPRLHATGVDG